MYCIIYCRICPIFQVSNVTGHNLDLLKSFLNLLTTRMPVTDDQPAEFQIDETYSVPVSAILMCCTAIQYITFVCISLLECIIFKILCMRILYVTDCIVVCLYVFMCMSVCACVCVCVCLCVCMFLCVCVCSNPKGHSFNQNHVLLLTVLKCQLASMFCNTVHNTIEEFFAKL